MHTDCEPPSWKVEKHPFVSMLARRGFRKLWPLISANSGRRRGSCLGRVSEVKLEMVGPVGRSAKLEMPVPFEDAVEYKGRDSV